MFRLLSQESNKLDLYASVIVLNTASHEIFNEIQIGKTEDELRRSALMCFFISTEISWKEGIEVVQLREHSVYLQEGLLNNLSDVKPFNKKRHKG